MAPEPEQKNKKQEAADRRFLYVFGGLILAILVTAIFWKPINSTVTGWFPSSPAPVTSDWHGDSIGAGGPVSDKRADQIIQEAADLQNDACTLNTEVAEVEKHFSGTSVDEPCKLPIKADKQKDADDKSKDSETDSKAKQDESAPVRPVTDTRLAGPPPGPVSSGDWGIPVGCVESREQTVGYRNWTICLEGLDGARDEMLIAIASQLYKGYAAKDGTPTKEDGTTEIDGKSFSWRVLSR